ncbi:MAG: phage tail family protein [Candidatus Daviesbacteria bacterium]|nr:MAG: phage tail family protein [Candidatus Daviesbacteria bacterium]
MIDAVFLAGIQLDNNKRFVTGIRNPTFPNISYTSAKKGGFVGQSVSVGNFSSYQIVMEWQIVGSSRSDLATQRDDFAKLLGAIIRNGTQSLRIDRSNGVDLQIDVNAVKITGDVQSDDTTSSKLLVEFATEYPFLQSITQQDEDVNIFTGGGMSIPMPIPMDMSVGGSNDVTIINGGTYSAYPRFEFFGPLQNPSLANITTGETLNLNMNLLTSSDSVVVDTFLRTAVLNPGGSNIRQFITGEFFTLEPGNNLLHLGAGAFNTQGKVMVTFRDHYLGI